MFLPPHGPATVRRLFSEQGNCNAAKNTVYWNKNHHEVNVQEVVERYLNEAIYANTVEP